MKIKYFKLENFAGIKYGINNSVFELTDIPSGIIKLAGDNGCGKSTTLHTLHIFSDDKSFLIKNEDDSYIPAIKELIVEHNGIDYHIVHQYNAKGSKKSFISKNGEELNANGNVGTFEEVVLNEFGFIDNTVSNSVTGVSQTHFIDLTSSDRKKEIASLLPNISEYEKKYKATNDSLNTSKKHLQMLSKLILENGSSDQILEDIKVIEEKIKPVYSDINDLDNQIKESGNKKAIVENNINAKITELNELNKFIQDNLIQYNQNIQTIEKFKNIPEELDLSVLNAKKDVATNNFNNQKVKINDIKNSVAQMNLEWTNYTKNVNHNKMIEEQQNNIKNQIVSLTNEIDIINKEISELLNIEVKPFYNQDTLDHIVRVGVNIKHELESLKNIYTIEIDNKSELDLYSEIEDIKKKVAIYENEQKEIDKVKSFINLFSSMNNSTSNEELKNIVLTDGCSFSKCGVQYKILLDNYKAIYNKKHTFLETNREKYLQYCEFIKLNNQYAHTYQDRYDLADKLKLDRNLFTPHQFNNVLVKLREYKNEIDQYFHKTQNIPDKQRYVQSKNEYLIQLNNNLNNLKLIDIKELSFTSEDIKVKHDSLQDEEKLLQSLEKNVILLSSKINEVIEYQNLAKKIEFNKQFDLTKEKLNQVNEVYNSMTNEINQLNTYLLSLNSMKEEKNKIILDFNKEIEDLKAKLAVINDHIQSKNKLDEEIEERQMVISALHPTKGIPSLLVKQYLNKIENMCNEILETTFDNSYKIFLENLEKDFFVRVYEKSTHRYIADVKSASSGQAAIVKMILSIALTKLAIGDSIYLRLDEADSVLSKDNLVLVETLLNSVLNKFGIEQVFIVTHNSSISVSDMEIDFDRENQTYDVTRLTS